MVGRRFSTPTSGTCFSTERTTPGVSHHPAAQLALPPPASSRSAPVSITPGERLPEVHSGHAHSQLPQVQPSVLWPPGMEKVGLGGLSALVVENSQFASPLVYHSLGGSSTIPRPRSPRGWHFKRVARSFSVASTVDVDCPLGGNRETRNTVRPARRKSGSIATAATATISRPMSLLPVQEVIDFGQRAADLEKVFNEDVFGAESVFTFPSLEKLVADLERQPRLHSDNRGTGEPSSSHALDTGVTVKRARKQPKKAEDAGSQIPQTSSFTDTKGVVPAPADAPKQGKGGGKRRLDLTSRIALSKKNQDKVGATNVLHRRRKQKENLASRDRTGLTETTWDTDDIWASEADSLISRYGVSIDLGAVSWSNLDRGVLSRLEEVLLAALMKPMKALQRLRRTLSDQSGGKSVYREATDKKLASAANINILTLRRQLELGRAARNKLIQHNLRLVLHQAHKYNRDRISLSLFDLCQEGVQGLIQGVDKFDPRKGYRFSTYAIYWIRNSILRAQTRSGHLLRSPFNLAGHKLNIRRARLDLMMELERPATDAEVAAKLGLGQDRFRDIVRSNLRTRSLHERSRVTGEEHVENFPDVESMESKLWRSPGDSILRLGMDDVLDSLKPKESIIIRQRFGLDGKGERSLGEIGRNLNLSREMVRRYEARGLLKLKHPTRVDYLRSYLSV